MCALLWYVIMHGLTPGLISTGLHTPSRHSDVLEMFVSCLLLGSRGIGWNWVSPRLSLGQRRTFSAQTSSEKSNIQWTDKWGLSWGNKTSEYPFDLDDGPLAGILINPDYKQSPKRDSSTDVSFTIVFSNDSARQNHGHDDNASLALMLIN